MKKPVPWTEPTRFTVEAPDSRKRKLGVRSPKSTRCRPAALAARKLTPTVTPKKATASIQLLTLLGHSESCADLRRAGRIAACDCRTKPMEDPAVAVGLAIHFARMSLAQRIALPTVIIELLARRVEEGDPACIVVAEWLDASGLLHLKPLLRSKRRSG